MSEEMSYKRAREIMAKGISLDSDMDEAADFNRACEKAVQALDEVIARDLMEHEIIQVITNDAAEAFWNVVKEGFPRIKTGDMTPEQLIYFQESAKEAVKAWYNNNSGRPSIPERIPDQPEEKVLFSLYIYSGTVTRESFEQLGTMIEEGYTSGYDIPLGMYWKLIKDNEWTEEEDIDIEDERQHTFEEEVQGGWEPKDKPAGVCPKCGSQAGFLQSGNDTEYDYDDWNCTDCDTKYSTRSHRDYPEILEFEIMEKEEEENGESKIPDD